MEDIELGPKTKREADRLLTQIGRAHSTIAALMAGSLAEGFVLGLETAGALRAGDAENLCLVFESALEQRLKIMTADRL